MAAFVVMAPPRGGSGSDNPVFVRDGFSFLALIFPPFWLLWHRLWLEAAFVFLLLIGLGALGEALGSSFLAGALPLLVSIYVGLEGAALRVAALRRRGWSDLGVIEADAIGDAECRLHFQSAPSAAPAAKEPRGPRVATAADPPGVRVLGRCRAALNMRVAIIDYGSGNLRSAVKAFERAAREAGIAATIELTADAERVRTADRIVLPGVGAFADCRAGLDAVVGMRDALDEAVRQKGAPFLGICVGMQLMADRGLEKTVSKGLGWIAGDVVEIEPADHALKIPQIGWNTIHVKHRHPLFDQIPTGEGGLHAYFVHSYQFVTHTPDDVLAVTEYGGAVTAAVASDNMAGTQFHPEKSQGLGLGLIGNFMRWKP